MKKTRVYLKVEDIERPAHRRSRGGLQISCKWVAGYAYIHEGNRTYPAMTLAEARNECSRCGSKIKIVYDIKDAV